MSKRRSLAITAGAATIALALTACGGDSGGSGGDTADGTSGEPITLKVTVFGAGGAEGDADGNNNLFRQYEAENEGITIEETNLGDGGKGLEAAQAAIGAGGVGLADVMMVEEGWLGTMTPLAADTFVDLRDFGADELEGRWIDWKAAQGTTPDGQVWAYGTDVGPQGLCFNQTQVEAAGIAKDRDELAEKLGGADATWDEFWEVGAEYTAATGEPWIGVPAFAFNAFVNQQDEGFYTRDNELNVEGNDALKGFLADIVEQQAAGVAGQINSWEWTNEDFHGSFGVHVCPGWMLGSISEAVKDGGSDVWDFADVFPGGATNWGGSFFAVPKVSEHQEEAAKLAAWLTADEQQITSFKNAGAFPSQVKAQSDPAVTGFTNELFNDAPVGQILASRAEGVVAQFKGEKDSVIQDKVFGDVIKQLNAGAITSADQAWQAALDSLTAQGIE
ncbi:extracellular solute-binding protein [Xylanimonas cellulosilytica]|nr:extracellular solute-binding protein [Xylanimonas cellulosilytica]